MGKTKHKGQCPICSRLYDLYDFNMSLPIPKIMAEKEVCYHCAFWLWRKELDDKLLSMEKPEIIPLVIDHEHMSIDIEKAWSGNSVAILRSDGKIFTPSQINHQGKIGKGFWYTFPNNAIYLEGEQLKYIKDLKSSTGLGLALITVPQNVVEEFFNSFYKSK